MKSVLKMQKFQVLHFDGDRDKFPVWSKQMRSVLALSECDASLEDKADLKAKDVVTQDKKMYHLLVVSLTGKAATVISKVDSNSGKKLWDELHETFAPASKPAVHAVHAQLLATKLESFKTVVEFVEELEKKMSLLRATDHDMDVTESLTVSHLCKELPESYSALVMQVSSKDLDWSDACKELRAFSDARGLTDKEIKADSDQRAFMTRGGAGKPGPSGENGPSAVFNGICHFCGMRGHRKANCAKANRVLDDYLAKQLDEEQPGVAKSYVAI